MSKRALMRTDKMLNDIEEAVADNRGSDSWFAEQKKDLLWLLDTRDLLPLERWRAFTLLGKLELKFHRAKLAKRKSRRPVAE